MAQDPPVTLEEELAVLDAELAKLPVVPSEEQEGMAREMRGLYVAFRRQHFTEEQALTMIGQTIGYIIEEASNDQ